MKLEFYFPNKRSAKLKGKKLNISRLHFAVSLHGGDGHFTDNKILFLFSF